MENLGDSVWWKVMDAGGEFCFLLFPVLQGGGWGGGDGWALITRSGQWL